MFGRIAYLKGLISGFILGIIFSAIVIGTLFMNQTIIIPKETPETPVHDPIEDLFPPEDNEPEYIPPVEEMAPTTPPDYIPPVEEPVTTTPPEYIPSVEEPVEVVDPANDPEYIPPVEEPVVITPPEYIPPVEEPVEGVFDNANPFPDLVPEPFVAKLGNPVWWEWPVQLSAVVHAGYYLNIDVEHFAFVTFPDTGSDVMYVISPSGAIAPVLHPSGTPVTEQEYLVYKSSGR